MAAEFMPLYLSMSQVIRAQILDGEIPNGGQIPSESELAARYRTTRGTARAAVDVLVNEGLVRREKGRGTFVVLRPVQHSIVNFGGMTDSLRGSNERVLSRVVEHHVVSIEREPTLRLVRLRGVHRNGRDEFMSLDTSLIPLARFPGIDEIDFEGRSLYAVFRDRYDVHPRRTLVTLSTHQPTAAECALLDEPAGGPALLVAEGSAFDGNDVPIERIRVLYPSRIQFTLSSPTTDTSRPLGTGTPT